MKYVLIIAFILAWLVRIVMIANDPPPRRPRVLRYYDEYQYYEFDPDLLEELHGVDDLDELTD